MEYKILIIEDDVNDLEIINEKLKGESFEIFIAQTEEKAFSILEDRDIDIVVLDIVLPGTDGFEICKQIRSDDKYEHIPVLFYSAVDTVENKLLGLEMGAADFLHKGADKRELVGRIKNLLISKSKIDKLLECSVKDALTNVYNKMYFHHRIEDEAERSARYKREFCCAIIDVDNFKTINEKLGYVTGDMILKKIAEMLDNNIRSADILCRWGGDKFGWLLPETTVDASYMAAERLRNFVITSNFGIDKREVSVTLSVGLSSYNTAKGNIKEIFYQAGEALKKAKEAGRNQTRVYKGDKSD